MMRTFKAELYKLLSVRSTYALTALAVVVAVVWGYIAGMQTKPAGLHNAGFLVAQTTNIVGIVAIIAGMVSMLHTTHEYRYSTIIYTLTSSNSRAKVLLAKILAASVYIVPFTLLVGAAGPLMAYVGVHMHGHTLAPQVLHIGDLLWRTLFYDWGFAMIGLVLAFLIRSQVGAIVVFVLLNGPLEGLPDVLLKKKAVYLPFDALGNLLGSRTVNTQLLPGFSHTTLALAFMGDLALGLIIAASLFLQRDAS